MKIEATYPFLLTCLLCLPLKAQIPGSDADQGIDPAEIEKAIAEFNRLKDNEREKANEVTVVLDPPSEAPPKAREVVLEDELPENTEPSQEVMEQPADKPVLVTGKPPQQASEADAMEVPETEVAVEPEVEADSLSDFEPLEGQQAEPALEEPERSKPGLEVRVESIRQGSGQIDPDDIQLKASFPAKPLSEAPPGWTMSRSEDAPEFKRNVELQPGTTISLSIRPHVLEPAADGLSNFAIREPGFETINGYQQKDTVSAILGRSVVQLDEDSKKMGQLIEDLHLILASLPKPEAQPEDPANP